MCTHACALSLFYQLYQKFLVVLADIQEVKKGGVMREASRLMPIRGFLWA